MVQSIANSFCAAILSGKAARAVPPRETILTRIGRGEIDNIPAKKRSGRIIGALKIFRQTAPTRLLHRFNSFSSTHVAGNNLRRDPVVFDSSYSNAPKT